MDYRHNTAGVKALYTAGSGASVVPAQMPVAMTEQAPFTPVSYIIPENNFNLTFNLFQEAFYGRI
jgi:hypothetical protein